MVVLEEEVDLIKLVALELLVKEMMVVMVMLLLQLTVVAEVVVKVQ